MVGAEDAGRTENFGDFGDFGECFWMEGRRGERE